MLGERLRAARLATGMSQQSLADAAGVSKMAISKYECGQVTPSSGVLLGLARALNVKIDFFFRSSRAQFTAAAFRCRKSMLVKQRKALAAQIQDWLERYVEAEFLVGDERDFRLPTRVRRKVKSLQDVEAVALSLRQTWDLGTDPIENLCEVLEENSVKVGPVDVGAKFDAALCFVDVSHPVIAISQGSPGDRQRFSMAHELGHLVLVADDLDEERMADRFAGAFLAPKPAVTRELGHARHRLDLYELHLLKHKYGLSMQAWVFRARDLGVISKSAATALFRSFRSHGWHKTEPFDHYPREEPRRLERLVRRALAEGLVTESRAAELLGRSVREFRRREASEHGGVPLGVRG